MSPLEESLVRWSARALVVLFVTSIIGWPSRQAKRPSRFFRVVWSTGAIVLVLHATLAMILAHHGSHAAAFEHTAARTEQLVGWRSGFGLYLNYLMTFWWLGDAGWLLTFPLSYSRRSRAWDGFMLGFFAFMLWNATVVFETGAGRWIGIVGTAVVSVVVVTRFRATLPKVGHSNTKSAHGPNPRES